MIRTLIVDDHEAIRAGVAAVLQGTSDLMVVGAVADERELWTALRQTSPDVVLLDYHLPSPDGVVLCRKIKHWVSPPAVLLYSAYAHGGLLIPALLAGADGLVSKASPAEELTTAMREAAAGRPWLPHVAPEHQKAAAQRLGPEERSIVAMAAHGTPHEEIAEALGLDAHQMSIRVEQIIAALKVDITLV